MTVIGLLRDLAALSFLFACLCAASGARAETVGFALVIGVDRYLGHPAGTACGSAATALRDDLRARHYTVETLLDPDGVAMRGAIGDFAAQLGGAPSGTTLIYFCGAAVTDGLRLFIFPSATDPQVAQPQTEGVVLQAPLNALSGTRGTVYADLDIFRRNAVSPAFGDLVSRLPFGLHVAAAAGEGDATLGRALASAPIDPSSPWPSIVSKLESEPGLSTGPSIAYLPTPAEAATSGAVASQQPVPVPASAPEPSQPAAPPPHPNDSPVLPPPLPHAHLSQPAAGKSKAVQHHHQDRPAAANPRIVRLQSALARAGCYKGPPNGQFDEATTEGIRAFQQRLGDAPTGVLTPAEIVRLLNP